MTGTDSLSWINPIGGLGDMLMVSGVLKLAIEFDPTRRFNLLRRSRYRQIFIGHPAIATIGYPPRNAAIVRVDYWSMEKLGPGSHRPFQVLARGFGLPTPVEENLYLPEIAEDDLLFHNMVPWQEQNVIIAPASDSPRKEMHPAIWHRLVDRLVSDGVFVMQVGQLRDRRIRNAYSVRGLTTPHQLIALIKKCDVVVTLDNFIMHAAHLASTRAVVLWGPTNHEVYGYPEQVHIQTTKMCDNNKEKDCIAPDKNNKDQAYVMPCPLRERHCMDQANPESIYRAVRNLLLEKWVS